MTNISGLNKLNEQLKPTDFRMPMLFVGHGNPMNAIEENKFSLGWQMIGKSLPAPAAVICISAHWETNGTFVTGMPKPRTIHDFYGFPNELFQVQYPANGFPELAEETKNTIRTTEVFTDDQWGLDHGAWSVLKHIFPEANVPVIQLSLDHNKSPRWHYELSQQLEHLRRKGVLFIGSGNMVHNLRIIDWRNPDGGYDWADEMNEKFKSLILADNHDSLINYSSLGKEAALAIPTPEHYLPLLYILALKKENESIEFFNDSTTLGSLSMTSLKISN